MADASLRLTREHVLDFRLRSQSLDTRLPDSADALRSAARAGLTDSMPRAALLSLHARVESVRPATWEAPSLAQVWGPRFSAYVVASDDWAPFTLGRMPRSGSRRQKAAESLARLDGFLGERRMEYSEAGKAMGVSPNSLRYATLTGRVMIHWRGSGKPLIWVVAPPAISEVEARRELVRRYLQTFGVGSVESFGNWAGVRPTQAQATFDELGSELIAVETPIGIQVALASDEPGLRERGEQSSELRLLPSGDTYYLLWGVDRELLVPDETHRSLLWTSRVWPGAVTVGRDVVGTWRRAGNKLTVSSWRPLTDGERRGVTRETETLPLNEQPIAVAWE